jgi:hypothetical protein
MKKLILISVAILMVAFGMAQTSPFYTVLDTNDLSGSGFGYSLEGPDAPGVQLVRQGDSIKIELSNSLTSNNYNESFNIRDTTIHNGDDFFPFQGYIVYQVVDASVNLLNNFFDATKVRIVAQSDILDNADTLVNHYLDTLTNNCDSAIMVEGANLGVLHTYFIDSDEFLGGTLQLGSTYCYYVLAYAYNGSKAGVDCNKPWQFLMSKKMAGGSGLHPICITINPVGISENDIYSNISLYPNPASNNINIEFENQEQLVNLQIMNVHGQSVFSKEYHNTDNIRVDIEGFSSGIYMTNIITPNGQKTVKFIKE